MVQKQKKYRAVVVRALKKSGKYRDGLGVLIDSLADTLYTLELCSADIAKLETTTVLEKTRYGEKMAPHPVFKIQRDAQLSLDKLCKGVGLTSADLGSVPGENPLDRLVKAMED